MIRILSILSLFLLIGCATPPEVKQLSIKQIEYFNLALSATSMQSEALIMATEKLVEDAKSRIDSEEKAAKLRLTTLVQRGGLDQSQAETVVKQISELSSQATASKKKLDEDIKSIKDKTNELNVYLKKMKDVHIALDSYIESEKAGEMFVNDVLNQPSVKTMLSQLNDLTPKIEEGLSQLTSLLGAL
ncbi:hypothetical protein [Bowmanella yangjiangensis]|uniref:Lipoprotein n=1 Tax=Bowmanella yangjiangensis TaxID=2811230 RepID=A0ABS3CNM1_9ALTE|nr:hypothetical protein [Bowmanella yangjiangensis]MBN7818704.1 hypothetical protein [Bowmanella yangjiangensis]